MTLNLNFEDELNRIKQTAVKITLIHTDICSFIVELLCRPKSLVLFCVLCLEGWEEKVPYRDQ